MSHKQAFAIVLLGKSVLIREGISKILRAANFRNLVSVSCIEDLPPGRLEPPRLLTLIIHTGDDFFAVLKQIEQLRRRYPKQPIAIVADNYRLDEMVSAFRAGANGYFVDVMTCEVFVKSIELVMMGETVLPPSFTSHLLDSESEEAGKREASHDVAIVVASDDVPMQQLSPREQSILRCLIEGESNKSIARKIDIAEATVKVHVKAILRKIRVQNRTQAAIWGMNNGSLARSAYDCLRPTADIKHKLPNSIDDGSPIKQIEDTQPIELISRPKNHVQISPIGRLTRKRINPRTTS